MKRIYLAAPVAIAALLLTSCDPGTPGSAPQSEARTETEGDPQAALADFREAYAIALQETGAVDIAFASGLLEPYALKVGVNIEPWEAMSEGEKRQWVASIHALWSAAYEAEFGDTGRSPQIIVVDRTETPLARQGAGSPVINN